MEYRRPSFYKQSHGSTRIQKYPGKKCRKKSGAERYENTQPVLRGNFSHRGSWSPRNQTSVDSRHNAKKIIIFPENTEPNKILVAESCYPGNEYGRGDKKSVTA